MGRHLKCHGLQVLVNLSSSLEMSDSISDLSYSRKTVFTSHLYYICTYTSHIHTSHIHTYTHTHITHTHIHTYTHHTYTHHTYTHHTYTHHTSHIHTSHITHHTYIICVTCVVLHGKVNLYLFSEWGGGGGEGSKADSQMSSIDMCGILQLGGALGGALG